MWRGGRRSGRGDGPRCGIGSIEPRFWEEVAAGVSTEGASAAVGISPALGWAWFRESGGLPPQPYAPLSGKRLSREEREEIAVLSAEGYRIGEIGRRLGRSASTIRR